MEYWGDAENLYRLDEYLFAGGEESDGDLLRDFAADRDQSVNMNISCNNLQALDVPQEADRKDTAAVSSTSIGNELDSNDSRDYDATASSGSVEQPAAAAAAAVAAAAEALIPPSAPAPACSPLSRVSPQPVAPACSPLSRVSPQPLDQHPVALLPVPAPVAAAPARVTPPGGSTHNTQMYLAMSMMLASSTGGRGGGDVDAAAVKAGSGACAAHKNDSVLPVPRIKSAKGRQSSRPVGRPRKSPVVDADGLVKRTRGEVEKTNLSALQEVADGKTFELLKLSAANTELQRNETLLGQLVDFREMQVEFFRRRTLPMPALSQLPPMGVKYPWLAVNLADCCDNSPKFCDPAFIPFPGSVVPLSKMHELGEAGLLHELKLAVRYMKDLLRESDAASAVRGPGVASDQLEAFMVEFRYVMFIACLRNPIEHKLRGTSYDPEQPGPPADNYLVPVLEAMQLTPEQRRRIADVYGVCRGRLSDFEVERARISAQLQDVTNSASADSIKQNELTEQLYECMTRSKVVVVLMGTFIRMRCMSTVQRARFFCAAYPYVPDCLKLAAILHAEMVKAAE